MIFFLLMLFCSNNYTYFTYCQGVCEKESLKPSTTSTLILDLVCYFAFLSYKKRKKENNNIRMNIQLKNIQTNTHTHPLILKHMSIIQVTAVNCKYFNVNNIILRFSVLNTNQY